MLHDWQGQLQAIAEQYGDPELVNSTMKACLQRRAFLFSAKDGWVILEPIHALNSVFVVAAFCSGQNAIARYQESVCCLSRVIGCASIRFKTKRRGFRRAFITSGWVMSVDTDGADLWELHHG